jgi:SAM-dependent methyltransferase
MNPLSDINSIANNIELIDDVWYSKGQSAISYPEQGNDICYQIEENSFWFNHRNSVIVHTIKNYPPNGCIFDIGGGNGFVTKSIKESGFDTFLVEPGIQGIENAKKRGIINLLCSTLEDAQFNKDSIPAIGIFDVLEHIENDLEFLKKLSSNLEPGGKLYITVPSYQFLWSHEDNSAGHYRRYTLKRLTSILIDSGFSIKYKSYFFTFLPMPIFFFRTLPFRFGHKNIPNNHSKEHSQEKGFLGKILKYLLKVEKRRINNLKEIPFGGSCIVVAQKLS